jgi:hypothetical protein
VTPSHYHLAAIDALLAARGTKGDRALDDDLQILLTDAVAALIDHVRYGKVVPSSLDRRWNVDSRAGALPLATLIEQVASAGDANATIEALKPTHFIYTGLKDALARMRSRAQAGKWPVVAGANAQARYDRSAGRGLKEVDDLIGLEQAFASDARQRRVVNLLDARAKGLEGRGGRRLLRAD